MIEGNLKSYYDWALLAYLGGWTDVSIPTSGIYGADLSILRPVTDPNYTNGQVWEAGRKDFVWETGVNYINSTGATLNPTPVGIPQVNGVPTTGSYYINHPQGKIYFSTPISTSATVKLAYSARYVQIYKGDDASWWREIQQNSYRVDSSEFAQSASGGWSIMGENRIQLPAVVIEVLPRGTSVGYELGGDALIAKREIQFSIITENPWDRKNLMDVFNFQTDRAIMMFDTNEIAESGVYPLNYKGSLVGTKMYPDWVQDYPSTQLRMAQSTVIDIPVVHPKLFCVLVKTTMEVIV